MARTLLIVLAVLLSLGAATASRATPAQPASHAETLYINANIYTMDPGGAGAAGGAEGPRAAAMLVRGDRIAAIGTAEELRAAAGPDAVIIDLGGRTVLPGLIDSHAHLASLGLLQLGHIDLRDARSFDELVARVKAHAATVPTGQWILGGRWDHESWADRQLPSHDKLSEAVPDHPVWLSRVDGHAALANAAAMELAEVDDQTTSPSGGEILRDQAGRPTGVFVDNAMSLVSRAVTRPAVDGAVAVQAAQRLCLSAGLTMVHDMGISPADAAAYRRLAESGTLKLRVYAALSAQPAPRYISANEPYTSPRFTLRAVKLYADGAMGSRGAWLLEPYADRPIDNEGNPYTGLAVMDPGQIEALTALALSRGWQVCTHAIGDRANREVLDAYQRALASHPTPDHRLRIEHAQLLHPADIPRFAQLGVIASMQPTHCTSDMRWVEARVGPERAEAGAYAWSSLLRGGAIIAGGSDFPVESHNPFLGFYAAVTRQDLGGNPAGGWYPAQRMTREEALRSMTLHAAHAAFMEDDLGSLTPGKFADFIVLDRDVMTCDVAEIPQTRVLRTVVGGEVVFTAEQ